MIIDAIVIPGLTFLAMILAAWVTSGRRPEPPEDRPPGPQIMPGGLPVSGMLDTYTPERNRYGTPFPVDTGPLLILSELAATGDAIIDRATLKRAREIERLQEQAERLIPHTHTKR